MCLPLCLPLCVFRLMSPSFVSHSLSPTLSLTLSQTQSHCIAPTWSVIPSPHWQLKCGPNMDATWETSHLEFDTLTAVGLENRVNVHTLYEIPKDFISQHSWTFSTFLDSSWLSFKLKFPCWTAKGATPWDWDLEEYLCLHFLQISKASKTLGNVKSGWVHPKYPKTHWICIYIYILYLCLCVYIYILYNI